MIWPLAFVMAAVPTALYGLLLWWLDRYEKEPWSLLLIAFCWGAIPAIALAVVLEVVVAIPISASPLGPYRAWGIAPFVEEPLKAAALLGLFLWARNEFDGTLDGIVYGALIGFGFSMTENALYFIQTQELSGSFLVRGILFGTNHAFFTSLAGVSLGAIRYRSDRRLKLAAFAGGLSLAIFFHALHNFFATTSALLGLVISWLVQSSGVLVLLLVAVLAWRLEVRWMQEELGDEIRAGVLSADEYADVVSARRRSRRQVQALLGGGWREYRRVSRIHSLATELAFCKSKERLADRHQCAKQAALLRTQIIALRQQGSESDAGLGLEG